MPRRMIRTFSIAPVAILFAFFSSLAFAGEGSALTTSAKGE